MQYEWRGELVRSFVNPSQPFSSGVISEFVLLINHSYLFTETPSLIYFDKEKFEKKFEYKIYIIIIYVIEI